MSVEQRTASKSSSPNTLSHGPVSPRILQRKCACGGSPGLAEDCESCQQKKISARPAGLQTKLAINKPGDVYEREADRVADQVTRGSGRSDVSGVPPRIQRYAGQSMQARTGTDAAPASVERVLASPGTSLEPSLRQDMEDRFGHDFSRVRVHSDEAAQQSAREVNASAYTVGHNVVFGESQFAPATSSGKRLLAHELTHVVQQGVAPMVLARGEPGTKSSSETPVRDPVRVRLSGHVLRRASFVESIADRARRVIDPSTRQVLADLTASVEQSPQHFAEFFTGELLETVKAHWLKIALISGGFIAAQLVIGALEAAPTGITQIIGALLEIVVLAVLGYFAAVEVVGAIEEGMRWWSIARMANGDPKEIAEASKAFVRLIWHIFMAVLAVAGVRARIRAGALTRIATPLRTAPPVEAPPLAPPPSGPPRFTSVQGGKPGKIEMRGGKVVSRPQSARAVGANRPVASSGEATARVAEPQPDLEPIPSPVREAPPLPETAEGPAAVKTGPPPNRWPWPPPLPLRPDTPAEGEQDEHGCTYQPIAMKFGHYPCHADYARSLSGQSREFQVTEPGGVSQDFDAMDQAGNLYEVKTGYGWLWSTRPDLQARIEARSAGFVDQSVSQQYVANRCGRSLIWFFNDRSAARYFTERQPIEPPVRYREFVCGVDSDDPETLTP